LQRAARKTDNLACASFRCVELLADVNHRLTKVVCRQGFRAAFSFYGGTNRFGSIDSYGVRRVAFPSDPSLSRSRMAVGLISKTASVWF